MKKGLFAAASVAILLFLSPAHAQPPLTKDSIQSFLNETTSLTHADSGKSDDDVRSFLAFHLSEDGRYESSILYEIPGYPPTPKIIKLNKTEFIDNVVSGRAQMKNYDSSVTLHAHTISADGKSADIETITKESGQMPIAPETYMDFQGTTVCRQSLNTQDKEIILTSADCEAQIAFTE